MPRRRKENEESVTEVVTENIEQTTPGAEAMSGSPDSVTPRESAPVEAIAAAVEVAPPPAPPITVSLAPSEFASREGDPEDAQPQDFGPREPSSLPPLERDPVPAPPTTPTPIVREPAGLGQAREVRPAAPRVREPVSKDLAEPTRQREARPPVQFREQPSREPVEPGSSREPRPMHPPRAPREARESRDLREPRLARESRLPREPRDVQPERNTAVLAEPKGPEIRFAPDFRLNIAYNPNCTHENDSRESIIRDVVEKSDSGARARCPRCDQQQMRFVAVKSALGLFAIGACDRCGYWYLM